MSLEEGTPALSDGRDAVAEVVVAVATVELPFDWGSIFVGRKGGGISN